MKGDGWAPRQRSLGGSLGDADPVPPRDFRAADDWRSHVESLYRDRADHLIGHFGSGSFDRETVRDIVHEAFAKFSALSVARRVMVARPDAYLYRICVNLIRDRTRAQETHRSHREENDRDWSHSPFAELEHRDTLRRLEAVMVRLNPKTREIFLAKRLDGMSYAEIAARTGLSVKGVEKHMSKAIAAVDRAIGRNRA
jgi:RNA polymerase sigma-70 factor (ECF subfamily)